MELLTKAFVFTKNENEYKLYLKTSLLQCSLLHNNELNIMAELNFKVLKYALYNIH